MKKLLFAVLLSAIFANIHAQQPGGILKKGIVSGSISFDKSKAPGYIKGRVYLPVAGGQIITGTGKVITEELDKLGQHHSRTQQTINDILVENSFLIQHVEDGKVIFSNGTWVKDLPSNLAHRPSLNKEIALKKALQKVGAVVYKWQDAASEAMIKNEQKNTRATFYPTSELVYYSGEGAVDPATLRLAYKFDIYALNPLSRQYVFIDAINGNVLGVRSRLYSSNTPAIGFTAYSGSQTITTDAYNGYYRLQETGRGNGIATYNLQKSTNYGNAIDFTNSTTTWNNVNANFDQYATDAHWGAEKTYDYYANKYGRNSIDNAGFALNSYVHYDVNYYNAYWDGERMTYGDGYAKPLTALDVCGHEISHGLTSHTSGLNYDDVSGGLNEGYSDIFGTAIENWARPGNWDWLIGSDFGTLRDMSNPKAYSQPDTYEGQLWYLNDPHFRSGPLDYWFYLLTTGKSGVNDKGCSYNVSGIGIDKAAAIAYRTNTVYLVSSSGYPDAAQFSIRAAQDLYGKFSNEAVQTGAAWAAVGVPVAPETPTINPVAALCTGSSTTLTLITGNLNSAAQWKWYSGSCGGNPVGTGNAIVVSPAVTTTYFVRAEGGCVNNSDCASITVVVNPLPSPVISYTSSLSFCEGSNVILTAPAGFNYKWSNNATTQSITATTAGNYSVTVSAASGCSTTSAPVAVAVSPLPPKPTITADGPLTFNSGGNVHLAASAGYADYKWSDGETSSSINVTSSGQYNVVVGSSGGCKSATSDPVVVTVLQVQKPVITASGPTTFCQGGNINLSAPAGFAAYKWSTGATTQTINVSSAGAYNVTVANVGGTSSQPSDNTIVTVYATPDKPSITNSGATTFCAGGNVTLMAPAGYSLYHWNTGATSSSINVSVANIYTVSVVNATGCSSVSSDPVQVTVNALPPKPVIATSGSTSTCAGSTVSLTAPPGFATYLWSNGSTSQSLNAAATGSYSVSIATASGCSSISSDPVMVTVNPLPQAPAISNTTVYQGAAAVILTAANCTGTLTWINPDNTTGTGNLVTVPADVAGIFVYKIACKATCTSAYATVTVTVLPSPVTVSHLDANHNQVSDNIIQPYLQLNNESNAAIAYKDLTVRYWFTAENYAPLTNLSVYYAQLGTSNVTMKYVKTAARQGAFGYVEYGFTAAAGNLSPNSNSGPIQTAIAKQDWSAFNESDDYSFAPYNSYTKTNRITVYRNGILIWGVEPPLMNPITKLTVYAQNQNFISATNTIRTYVKLNNEGNQPVAYKDISMRYWFTNDGTSVPVYYLDYAQLGNNNISSNFVSLSPALPKADRYLKLSFPSLSDSLYPLSSTGIIQQRIARQDWSIFNESNDYSYKPYNTLAENDSITVYIKGLLSSGKEPSANSLALPGSRPAPSEPLGVTVLNNPVIGNVLEVIISGARGQSLKLQVIDGPGRILSEQQVKNAADPEHQRIHLNVSVSDILYLRVIGLKEFKTVKIARLK